ncbi:butyrophilin-like protein 8 isoform X3 [Poecilia formosa]|nr:PREDICTED: butyrophilin-like protein 8 isoform X3 [Poecilia formosa]
MYFWLCLVLGAIFFKGGYSADVHPEKVVAFAGGNAVLPCKLKIPVSDHVSIVEWSKEGLDSDIVFLYRDGFETFEMKNLDFEFRTSLFMREVKNGNVSLRISNLKPSDAGIYQCLIIQRNRSREATKVELAVAAASEPKLAVVFIESEGATVAYETSCWLSLDDKGNDITDEGPNQEEDSRGCFSSRQNFSMQDSTRRIVWRMNQLEMDQNRTAEILLSVSCTRLKFEICCIVGVISVILLLSGISICMWQTSCKNARKKINQRKSSDSDLRSVNCEMNNLLNNTAENTGKIKIEDLEKQIYDLKLESSHKDETIRKLQEDIRSMGDVYQHNKTTNFQSSSESQQNILRYLTQTPDLNTDTKKIQKKSSKHVKFGHEKLNSKLSPGRSSKRKLDQSNMSTLGASGSAAGLRFLVHPTNDHLINRDYSDTVVHRRHFSWPLNPLESSNRYSPLADMSE